MQTNKTKILFLTHYFPPEVNAPANRTYEHAKIWAMDENVQPIIVTNFPNHPKGKLFDGYKNKIHQKEIIDGIEVHRVWTFVTANEGFLLRTVNYIIYMLAALFFVLFSRIKFDIVIATSPQFFTGLAGKYISKIKRKSFILEIRDLWPESIITVGAIENEKAIRFLENIELDLYKSANHIVSVTRSFKYKMIQRGINQDKISVIYNGISKDLFELTNGLSNKEITKFIGSSFSIGYIGTIGMAHSIETLVESAEELKNDNVKFVIVGAGAREGFIKELIKEKGLTNIRLFSLQEKSVIPSIIGSLDLFCVHLKNTSLFKTVIPSKIFEGMIMKKPILMGVDGESRKIVMDAKCGIPFEPENSKDLTSRILEAKKDKDNLKKLGMNGYDYVLKNFDRSKIASNYLKLIKNLIID